MSDDPKFEEAPPGAFAALKRQLALAEARLALAMEGYLAPLDRELRLAESLLDMLQSRDEAVDVIFALLSRMPTCAVCGQIATRVERDFAKAPLYRCDEHRVVSSRAGTYEADPVYGAVQIRAALAFVAGLKAAPGQTPGAPPLATVKGSRCDVCGEPGARRAADSMMRCEMCARVAVELLGKGGPE